MTDTESTRPAASTAGREGDPKVIQVQLLQAGAVS